VECAEGDVGVVGKGCHNVGALQDKAPLGSGEWTRAASNGVSLGDGYVAKRCCTEVGRCDKCRIDAVPIWPPPNEQTQCRQSGMLTSLPACRSR